MYCQKCGFEIEAGSKFCPKCGVCIEGSNASNSSAEFKWAWLVIFVITCLIPIMGRQSESFAYGFGYALAAFAFGWIVAPLVYLFFRFVLKKQWKWFNWFNAATGAGLVISIFGVMMK